MKVRYALFILAALVSLACSKIVYQDKVVTVPVYPDLEGEAPDTIVASVAKVQYYGAYSEKVDRWYLTLFEKDGVEYIHEDDQYIGKGNVIVLCMQTSISGGAEKDIPVIVGSYATPSSYSDLQIGQFEFGYDYPYDHPYKGIRYATYGTYVLDLEPPEYIPLHAADGAFEVKRLENGEYEVSGVIVDTRCLKHYFKYAGPIKGVTEWDYYLAPNSALIKDVSLTRQQLPSLQMRRTELPFGSSKNIDIVRLYLSEESVIIGTNSGYNMESVSGSGAVVVLEMVVQHGQANLPSGEYSIAPTVGGGYDGSMLTPFHFKEGMPHRFTNREGSWYFNLAQNGHWTGDYAQVHDGKVTISYEQGSDTPVVHAELVDDQSPAHKIIIDWK
ncbi:MAG: hypothetical protein MJY67_05590 [Bacteroidales bacterium]|nr:hypothetical protein [Bacteroidales bacterium]